MSLLENLNDLSSKVPSLKQSIKTESDTTRGLVFRFLNVLGYDPYDISQIKTEYPINVPEGKPVRADVVILDQKGKPVIVIEVKAANKNIDAETEQKKFKEQLKKYFENYNEDFKVAILTNGIKYYFYTNEKGKFKMDDIPFLVFDLENIEEEKIKSLEKFSRENLDIKSILDSSLEGKISKVVEDYLLENLSNPSPDFIYSVIKLATGKNPPKKPNLFNTGAIAIKSVVRKHIKELLESLEKENEERKSGIITTDEEKEGFFIVKSILLEIFPSDLISYEDTKSYFGIWVLKPDKNKRDKKVKADWVVRLYLNNPNKKFIELNDSKDRNKRTRIPISKLEDILPLKPKILEVAKRIKKENSL